jgi:hypothetical protein
VTLSGSGPTQLQGNRSDHRGRSVSSEPLAYFAELCDAAGKAAQAVGGYADRFLKLADRIIQLRFAGPALVPHTIPALAHLETEPSLMPDLIVRVCDSASTGVSMPASPWRTAEQTFRGEAPGAYNEGHLHTSSHEWVGVLSMLDGEAGSAVFWAADAGLLHFSMRGAPLRDILHWWLVDHGSLLVHGAGVGDSSAGVLLTGRGSSGKSTTALACLGAGLLYAGDDHVAVGIEPTPWLYSLYNTAHLDIGGSFTFSDLASGIQDPEPSNDFKLQIFIHQHRPDAITTGFPLVAIVLPRVAHRSDSRLRVASGAEMLIALAPATILSLPGAGQGILRRMTRLARQVPSYVLEVGTDLSQIPPIIMDLLAEHR